MSTNTIQMKNEISKIDDRNKLEYNAERIFGPATYLFLFAHF